MASNKQHTPSGEGLTKYIGRGQKRKRTVVEEPAEEAEDSEVEEQRSSGQASPEGKKRRRPKQAIRGGTENGKGRISTKLTGVGRKKGAQLRSATPEEEEEEEEEGSGRDTSSPKNTSERRSMRRGGYSKPNVVRQPVKPPPGAAIRKKRVVAKEPQPEVEDDEFEVPEGAYDSLWDSDDERELRKYWTREHDVILNHTQPHEDSLWKKTYQLFGLAPPELIPSHIALDISEKKGVPDPGNEKLESDEVLVNTNWAPDTCLLLCEIVCCPAFKDRVDYLRYVLAYVLYLRIGSSEEFPKPYKMNYLVSGRQPLAEAIARISEGATAEDVLAVIETVQGTEQPPHHRFLDILRNQARGSKRKVETKALIRQDLTAIVKAWDTYAEELDSGLDLKHMADYAKAWNTKHPKPKDDPKLPGEKYSTAAIRRLKKEYMISQWRESNKKQRRLSPGKGRRRAVRGPDGDRQQRPGNISGIQEGKRARKQNSSGRRGRQREALEELGGTSVPETPKKPREKVTESVVDLISREIKIKPPSDIPIWGRNWPTQSRETDREDFENGRVLGAFGKYTIDPSMTRESFRGPNLEMDMDDEDMAARRPCRRVFASSVEPSQIQ